MAEKLIFGQKYFLKENISGTENSECSFMALLLKNSFRFIFDVEDREIVSPYFSDNEDIYNADAVEVFISPDGDLTKYKELEVSPFGVRFYAQIRNEDGVSPVAVKENPAFNANSFETENGYRVIIDLPFSDVGLKDLNLLRLNAFRLDKRANGEQLLYALNPTLCDKFHRPKYFVGVSEK